MVSVVFLPMESMVFGTLRLLSAHDFAEEEDEISKTSSCPIKVLSTVIGMFSYPVHASTLNPRKLKESANKLSDFEDRGTKRGESLAMFSDMYSNNCSLSFDIPQ